MALAKTDVLIIGGGITGVSVARELSQYKVDVTLVEKEADVSCGVSKYSTGVIYVGLLEAVSQVMKSELSGGAPLYDPENVRLKMMTDGYKILEELLHTLDVRHNHPTISIFARNSKEVDTLKQVEELVKLLGGAPAEMIDGQAFRELEPNVAGEDVVAALIGKGTMKIDPWELVIALAENARDNGVKMLLNTEVQRISRADGLHVVETSKGTIKTEFIVNAAGKYVDKVADMAGARDDWSLKFIKAIRMVGDKRLAARINTRTGPVPLPNITNGLAKTVSGNLHVVCGDYIPVEDREDVKTTREAMRLSIDRAQAILPGISGRDVINAHVGVSPFSTRDPDNHLVEPSRKNPKFINALVRMPGLAPSPIVAQKIVGFMADQGLKLVKKPDFNPYRKAPPRLSELSDEQIDALISKDTRYGHVVCRCETVTEGEIVEAIKRGATTLQGIKFRTRASMGTCQGNFCGPKIAALLARELSRPLESIIMKSDGSEYVPFKKSA